MGVRGAVSVGLQAGGVGHNVSHVVLLFHPMEQVGHRALGVDGHVLPAVRLSVERDGGLLHVLLIICAEREKKSEAGLLTQTKLRVF